MNFGSLLFWFLESKEFLKLVSSLELKLEFRVKSLKRKLCDIKLGHVIFQTLLVSCNLEVRVIFGDFFKKIVLFS